jgi:hypothetical protein
MYGGQMSPTCHPHTSYGQPPFHVGPPISNAHCGGIGGRGGRRPTIDQAVIDRAIIEATGFDKDSLNRPMKMTVYTVGPNT